MNFYVDNFDYSRSRQKHVLPVPLQPMFYVQSVVVANLCSLQLCNICFITHGYRSISRIFHMEGITYMTASNETYAFHCITLR